MSKQKDVDKTDVNIEIDHPVKKPKKTTLISGAEYWDFETNPIFIGIYDSPVIREQDEAGGEGKAGDIIGFNFIDETDEMTIISNSHSIEKVLQMEVGGIKVINLGQPLEIEFKGKGENSRGQPFNRFKISLLG